MRVFLSCLMVVALTACGGASEEPAEEAPKPAEPAPEPESEAPEAEAWSLPEDAHPALTDPSKAQEQAPETFDVRFETSEGPFTVRFHREWSPHGADRIYNLVKIGFYDEARFFRAIDNFMVQFGISGYPEVNEAWRQANIPDDPVKKSNTRGMVTFAKSNAPNSRSTQLFINFKDNSNLDGMGFSPVGEVVEGMEVVDSLYTGYGEGAPRGGGPHQMLLQQRGNAYLVKEFPQLDHIERAVVVED